MIALVSTLAVSRVFQFFIDCLCVSSKLIARCNGTVCAGTNLESSYFKKTAYMACVWFQFLYFLWPPIVITGLYTAIAVTLKVLAGTPWNAQGHATKKRRQAINMAVVMLVVLFYLSLTPHSSSFVSDFIPYWRPSFAILSTLNLTICLSFLELSHHRGLRKILYPCGRRLNGNVTPKCAGEMI